jgi:hypothetical protein
MTEDDAGACMAVALLFILLIVIYGVVRVVTA